MHSGSQTCPGDPGHQTWCLSHRPHPLQVLHSTNELMSSIGCVNEGDIQNMLWLGRFENSDRPILIFFITDTDYLCVYVPDNRYAEPMFIYCYKVHK